MAETRAKQNILIVDDDPKYTDKIAKELRNKMPGAKVFISATPEDAERIAKKHKFDFLVTDIMFGKKRSVHQGTPYMRECINQGAKLILLTYVDSWEARIHSIMKAAKGSMYLEKFGLSNPAEAVLQKIKGAKKAKTKKFFAVPEDWHVRSPAEKMGWMESTFFCLRRQLQQAHKDGNWQKQELNALTDAYSVVEREMEKVRKESSIGERFPKRKVNVKRK